ncbi:MAG: helix-hairpin-helix domain-containing protein [Thermoanaerobaculia bacterium]
MTEKRDVTRTLDEIASYLEIDEPNPFKSMAFRKAARAIEDLDTGIDELVRSGEIRRTAGVGKVIAPIVVELVESGRASYLEELRAKYPPGILELMRVPGLGAKKITLLYAELGIASIDDLETAAREGRLRSIRGFGEKTAQKVLDSIASMREHAGQFLLVAALDSAELLLRALRRNLDVAAAVTGSARRRLEVVDRVELVVATETPEETAEAIRGIALLEGVARDDRAVHGTVRSIPLTVHLTTPDLLPLTLLFSTGTGEFVDALRRHATSVGFELTPSALLRGAARVEVDDEDAIFRRLELEPIPPELRESGAVLERAEIVTDLVDYDSIRGTFHVHSTWSDGRNTLREMIGAARELGFSYVGISDHSKAAAYAGGLTEDDLEARDAELDEITAEMPDIRIFRGTEADILQDGTIDYDPETLDRFDFVVASIHSRFRMNREEMTQRIVRALHDPHVTFLGHLTGRLLLSRAPYELDFDAVFRAAAENGVMIEINGSPKRLDVDWRHLERAMELGVSFSIHPDAHSTAEMANVIAGTWVARKGGVPRERVFNARPLADVESHLASRRARAR